MSWNLTQWRTVRTTDAPPAPTHAAPLGCGKALAACACACSHCDQQLTTCTCHCGDCGGALHLTCRCSRPRVITAP